jgi:hypothetical protein
MPTYHKKLVILMSAIFLLIFSTLSVKGQSLDTLTIDFSKDLGPVTHRATGFIGNISDTKPPDSVILPLKPKLLSWNRSYSGINRAMQNGMMYQIKLHNKGAIPSTWDGDWSTWENLVRSRATEAKTKNYTNVEFDIWNEPEFGSYWDGAIDERYFQMWIRAYRTIKSVDPNFLVAGPSSTNYGWTRDVFLPRAIAEKAVPDVLTYHELWSGGSGVATRVQNMRTHLSELGYPNWKISINEYDSDGDARIPGVIVKFIYEFELAKVHSAAKACWQEGGDWNCEVHLNNTLTYPDQKPRAVWWVYKSYADMTGRITELFGTTEFAGLATKDSGLGTGHILLGNLSTSSSVNLNLTNLDKSPFYSPGGQVKVTVNHIPNTGFNALVSPITLSDSSHTPVNNNLTVPISGMQPNDVYLVSLARSGDSPTTPTPTAPTSSPTTALLQGDINNDGVVNILDYTLLSNAFGSSNSEADINKDGVVNILDYTILSNNFGKSA